MDLLPNTPAGRGAWEEFFASAGLSEQELDQKLGHLFAAEAPSRVVARLVQDGSGEGYLGVSMIDSLGAPGHWLVRVPMSGEPPLTSEIKAAERYGKRLYPTLEVRTLTDDSAIAYRLGAERVSNSLASLARSPVPAADCARTVRATFALFSEIYRSHEYDLRGFHDTHPLDNEARAALTRMGLAEIVDEWDAIAAAWPSTRGAVTVMTHGGLTPQRVLFDSSQSVIVLHFSDARIDHWAKDFVSLEAGLRLLLYEDGRGVELKVAEDSLTDLGRLGESDAVDCVGRAIQELRLCAQRQMEGIVSAHGRDYTYPSFSEEYLLALAYYFLTWLAANETASEECVRLVVDDCRAILIAQRHTAIQGVLFGMISCNQGGVERVLVRTDGRSWDFPLLSLVPEGVSEVDHIDSMVEDVFGETEAVESQFLSSGFSAPDIRRLNDCGIVDAVIGDDEISVAPVYFEITMSQPVDLRHRNYTWVRKNALLDGMTRLEPRNPELLAVLHKDWITPLYGRKVLNCVDVLVFRETDMGPEFLLLRRDNASERMSGWEYPKGGMELHETAWEAAARELLEETGMTSIGAFISGPELGKQTADVSWRQREEYDTLSVTGVTYLYVGTEDEIIPSAAEGLVEAKWVSLPEAERLLWIGEYGQEFLHRWDERRSFILHSIARPRSVVFQITERCEVGCLFCHRRVGHEATPDVNDLRRIVQALAQRGIQRLTLTGGEPLLLGKSTVFDLIECAHHNGIHTSLSTTAIGLTRDDYARLDSMLDHLLLPLHAITPEIGAALYHKPDTWANVMGSIAEAIRWTRNSDVIIEVCTVVTSQNLGEIRDIGRWLFEQDPQTLWRVDQYYPNGFQDSERVDEFAVTEDQFLELQEQLLSDMPDTSRIRFNLASSREAAPDFMITPQGNLVTSSNSEYEVVGDARDLMTAEFKNRVHWDSYRRYCREWE